jgi:peptide/nickel transport system substrate-binding protein
VNIMATQQNDSRIPRRTALALLLSGAGTVVVAACGGAAAPASPTAAAITAPAGPLANTGTVGATGAAGAPTTATGAAQAPKTGGTLRYGISAEIVTLGFNQSNDFEILQGMYDSLLTYDRNLQPVPHLVESWEQGSDLKQIKLNLRKGVTFHNGREFTSDDVAYNVQRTADPTKSSPVQLVGLAKVWTVEAPDKYTAIMKTDQARIGVFDLLTQVWMGDKQLLEGPDAKSSAIGTGPFTFVEWSQGDHVSFARNPNYWRSGRPYLDGYTVQFTKDPQAMVVRLEAGALDFVNYPPTSDAIRLSKDAAYQILPAYDVGLNYVIWMNVAAPPFDKTEVRQAMNYAIDRQRFVDTTLGGLVGPPRDLPWADRSPASEPSKNARYTFDLDKAAALLKSAGVGNFTAEMNYSNTGPVQEFGQLAQFYQADLAKIGVTLNIAPMDNATWVNTAVKAAYRGMAIGQPGGFGGQDATSGIQTGAFGAANAFTNFKNETYTQLVQSAGSEIDLAKRKQLYSQINDIILDQSFTMNVSSYLAVSVAAAKVHGVQRAPTGGGPILVEAWLD